MKNLLTLALAFGLLFSFSSVNAVFYPAGGGQYRLQASIGTTNTTIRLSSFTEPVSGIKYTMSYLNSDIECATIDPQTSRSEFVSFSGITQNGDGSATLTGVVRGLGRAYPYTASSTLAQSHPGQSVFILSDAPCLFAKYSVKENNEVITGEWDFPEPTANSNPATKFYVDNAISSGSVTTNRVTVTATAGSTYATGTPVYWNTTDSRWYPADADLTTNYIAGMVGIAQGAGSAGLNISGGVLIYGLDTTQVGMTPGTNIFVSGTAGATTTSTTTLALGKANSATQLYVDTHFNDPKNAGTNTFTGTNTFATSTTIVGSFPAYNIGKNRQTFASPGTTTFSAPSGITKVKVKLVGGGGGGGGNTTNTSVSQGGGASSYSEENVDITGTSTIQVFVGSGGTAGAATGGNGGAGSWSTFGTNGFYTLANGGPGGDQGCGNGTPASASGGDLNVQGSIGLCGTTSLFGGAGAASLLGASSGPQSLNNTNGLAGLNYGSGGSGAFSDGNDRAGGAGSGGIVIIEW